MYLSGAMTSRLVIDTDPGVDDALAIFLALNCPEIEVVGLTTVFGNAEVSVTTRNALAILKAAGRMDIPVAMGAAAPIVGKYLGGVPQVHGADGLGDGGVFVPMSDGPLPSASAAEFIWQTVTSAPGQITLLALGPLTNLALALKLHPELPSLVAQIVVMGGNALVPGNATPCAEANMYNDPEAADIVFEASWPLTMVGLDVTHKANLTGMMIDQISAVPAPENQLLRRALPLYRSFFERTNGIDGIFLHDPSAVAYLAKPSLFESKTWPICVETQGIGRGKTWPSMGDTDHPDPPAWKGRPKATVCTEVQGERVAELVAERLSKRSK
jgi:inosine-uridine nucleoside N-ribohydrolase